MERILKKIAFIIYSYHKTIVIFFAFLTVASIITIFRMEINTDIIDVLPRGNETVVQFKNFIKRYQARDTVTIVIASESGTIDENIDLIESLARKLGESPLIEYVDYSPFQYRSDFFIRHFPLYLDKRGMDRLLERLTPAGIESQVRRNKQKLLSPFSSPLDHELIEKDPLSINEIIRNSLSAPDRGEGLDLGMGYYFSKDDSLAILFAKPKGVGKDMAFVRKLKRELDTVIASAREECETPDEVRVGLTGSYILAEEVRVTILHDIVSSFLLSVVLIALLIWIVYRVRFLILLITAFNMAASLSMTLAVAYLIYGSLNIVTSIVAAVLIGLYVDYSMLTFKRFGDELKSGKDIPKILEVTLTKTGPAIMASAVTTSLSFFSILVSRFEGLHELGIVSGIGVLLCLVSTILLMNALLVWGAKRKPGSALFAQEKSTGADFLTALILKRARIIIAAGLLLSLFLLSGLPRLSFDNNPDNVGPRYSAALAQAKELHEKIGDRGEPLYIIVPLPDEREFDQAFDRLEETLTRWKKSRLIASYDSLGMIIPSPSEQKSRIERLKRMLGEPEMKSSLEPDIWLAPKHEQALHGKQELEKGERLSLSHLEEALTGALEKNGLVYDEDRLRAYLSGIIQAISEPEPVGLNKMEAIAEPRLQYFLYRDVKKESESSIAAYIYPHGQGWDRGTVETLKKEIGASGSGGVLLGKEILFKEIKQTIIRVSVLATIAVLLLNIFVLYLYMRRTVPVLLIMLPVTLGFLVTLGFMGLIRAPFNFVNVGTIALIFGFGVDYGIYVMQAYLREDRRDLGNALRLTGKNVMMCAATTIAGCGSLVTAKSLGIASIGLVLSLGAIACAATALLVLPAMIHLLKDTLNKGRSKD